jgi:hypothetical protein
MRNSRRPVDRIRSTASGAEEMPLCNPRRWSLGVINYSSLSNGGNATIYITTEQLAAQPFQLQWRKCHWLIPQRSHGGKTLTSGAQKIALHS